MRKLEIYNSDSYARNVIISGAGRSGKTSLCKLWASTKGVEWLEEPNSLIILSYALLMGNNGQSLGINKETCEALWGLNLREHINDIVLGREGFNFRPGDLSSVWEFKNVNEIMERLYVLKSRDDAAKYIESNKMTFLIDIPEMISPLSEMADEKFNSKMLVIVREPSGVAEDVTNKGWFEDNNLIDPLHGNNYTYKYDHKGVTYRLPFWLAEKDAEEFLEASGYVRGLIYWLSIAEEVERAISDINEVIRYEDMVKDPMDLIERLCEEYGGAITDMTINLSNSLKTRKIVEKSRSDMFGQLSSDMRERIENCCKRWGYI